MDQDSKSTEVAWAKAPEQHAAPVPLKADLVPARRQTDLPAVIRKPGRRAAWRLRAFVALAVGLAGAGATYY
jgi:hypothetical protein